MKDPAFLFYPNDYLGGTLGMTFEQKGAYIELLMVQFNRGHMTSHMIGQVLGQNGGQIWSSIKDKFSVDSNGCYFNERLEFEQNKRKAYSDSRRNNIKGKNQHSKKSSIDNKNIGHMTSHMENENRDVNINESKEVNAYVRNEQTEKSIQEILTYFGIDDNPANHLKHALVAKMVSTLFANGLIDTLNTQFVNYQRYKKESNEKPHGLNSFCGTDELKFLDGGWNAENWANKLRTYKEQQQNGKATIQEQKPDFSEFKLRRANASE